jgi:hypothetical protein
VLRIPPSVVLGGLVVNVFAIAPKVREYKPGEGDEFLRPIKISSTSSFGEVTPEAECRKILRQVK